MLPLLKYGIDLVRAVFKDETGSGVRYYMENQSKQLTGIRQTLAKRKGVHREVESEGSVTSKVPAR